MDTLITMFGFLFFFVGGILLQMFLSNKKSKMAGFILPGISFILSVIAVLGVLGFISLNPLAEFSDGIGTKSIIEIINARPKENLQPLISMMVDWAIHYFFLFNLPTVILVLVHYACRRKQKRSLAIEKMRVQDL